MVHGYGDDGTLQMVIAAHAAPLRAAHLKGHKGTAGRGFRVFGWGYCGHRCHGPQRDRSHAAGVALEQGQLKPYAQLFNNTRAWPPPAGPSPVQWSRSRSRREGQEPLMAARPGGQDGEQKEINTTMRGGDPYAAR